MTVSVTVNLTAASDQVIFVAFATVDGTATGGMDYVATNGVLTFSPGEITKAIPLEIIGDRVGEPNESLPIRLSDAQGATIADGEATVVIEDDEPRIRIDDVSKTEGRKKNKLFTFTVTLSQAYDEPITVYFATLDGTAVGEAITLRARAASRSLQGRHQKRLRSKSAATASEKPTKCFSFN